MTAIRKIVFLLSISLMILSSCGDRGNRITANDANKVPQDNSVWSYHKTYDERFGTIENINCLSDNYHVINGRKIALMYNFQIIHTKSTSPYRYCCSFMFFDVTDKEDSKPTFAMDGENDVLDIRWNNGTSLKLKANYIEPGVIVFIKPESAQMQTELNSKQKFSVDVTTLNDKVLEYKFDTSERGPIVM